MTPLGLELSRIQVMILMADLLLFKADLNPPLVTAKEIAGSLVTSSVSSLLSSSLSAQKSLVDLMSLSQDSSAGP